MTQPNSPGDGFEKWKNGFANEADDPKWHQWDCAVQLAADEFNRHLGGVEGYVPLDWLIVKSMLWVESGAGSAEWNRRVMQIGVEGDPGLSSLLSGKEGGELVLPAALKNRLTAGSVRTQPVENIRAGIGYLLMKLARYDHRELMSQDAQVYSVTVKPGDSLDKIARAHGTTVETLKRLNPGAAVLRPEQVLKYQKVAIKKMIVGWRPLNSTTIATLYNGGGDPNYARKLDFTLDLVRKIGATTCAQ
ncbi:LysM peptidoglycan-binding domain-containing protein [Roseateles sp. DAIF2]|uniref:LysM peptidoglycan-binding domain-containing protein n=1 Tax=Roseateles sp. DAIF2 TaxID=2714952 RepID=UPI0018A25094|nr:LysM domain-containing protein [Roseateles sp. DAIF2]QPF71993.1 LysM peptidoglycan-binding domain-containing protein [Roseateles sp. DAIF2]